MALIHCPECGKQVSDSIKTCPKCGYKLKKSHPILTIVGIIFALFVVVAMLGDDEATIINDNSQQTTEPQQKIKAGLELVNDNWCHDKYDIKYVCGTIVNNTSNEKSLVTIAINLYDAAGNQIESTMDIINNLEPGASWKFKAIVSDDNAQSYKIKEIISH